MTDEEQEAQARISIVTGINVDLANIAAAKKRVADAQANYAKVMNDAKSQIGTAQTELSKLQQAYAEKVARLTKKLPVLGESPPQDPPAVSKVS